MNPATAEARLKKMVAWDTDPVLCQEDIEMLLQAARRVDLNGYFWDDAAWLPTYHLDWAAAEAWRWKAGACVDRYKVLTQGTELSRHQIHQHCVAMEAIYAKAAAGQPHSIRVKGQLVDDRTRAYSTVPWWWEVTA